MPPIEPSADVRKIAQMFRATFNAYVEVGFSEEQAMELLKAQIEAASS